MNINMNNKPFRPSGIFIAIYFIVFTIIWYSMIISMTKITLEFLPDGFVFITIIFYIVGLMPLYVGIKGIINGLITIGIKKHGKKSKGKVLKLWMSVSRGKYGSRYTPTIYFKCYNDIGTESFTRQVISRDLYEILEINEDNSIPVLVHKGKAILDLEELKSKL